MQAAVMGARRFMQGTVPSPRAGLGTVEWVELGGGVHLFQS